ncbi:RagB/SusD family nutrient uptake outer membrane protein [Chitinophaga nivalis]|uniref:RagB/SusD family nutrient uptake outer membrane protein n=1 Tax=Chitinophaga nivalis TaxID=2991709 RepID=A0ABT3IEN1_9BACT|nr:RagB/SusD family nutrient uptake outer membrane protein [Chitinophaga nivalis]MCW3467895.1 RagB/SusD family nutrient uptake outer membrane protein [Chitinophaga nivalis]MCW3482414.1 RagB/SusD family nutrient uptake outer membrane protein [Chitinophaga nivalis]
MKRNIMNKTWQLVLCGAMLIGGGSGCSKFLDEKDPSNLSPDSYFTLPEHADAAVFAAYARTRLIGKGAGIFSNNYQLLDAPTGTMVSATAQNSDLNNLLGLVYNGDNLHIQQWWKELYKEIAQTNLVLDNVPKINPMDEGQRTRVLGEARFLRAWAYFYAVRFWGDIPLILQSQTPGSPDFSPGRAKAEDVYNAIVADLKIAEAAGLPWIDNSGRASMAAVKSQLAKVYLTMAGYPLNKGAAYYKLAADKAKEVIDYATAHPAEIGLFSSYADLHNPAMNNKLEHIFEVQYLNGVEENPLQTVMLPNNSLAQDISEKGSGQGSEVVSPSFYASFKKFEPADKRTDEKQFFYTSYYVKGNGAPFPLGAPYIFKHFDVTCHGEPGKKGTGVSNLNVPQIRYAEVLLIYAEAQNRTGLANGEAYAALNAIRGRAGLAALSGLDQASFEKAVWRERWHEFCFEGIIWFDMVRLRKVYNEDNNGFDEFVGHINKNSGQALKERHLLYPLPLFEMKNNPNLKPQNPGY